LREHGGGDDGGILDADAVVDFELLLEAAEMATVSSTVGSPTMTVRKRRARAASFSTCFLYSMMVVAPMQRSSPRAARV